MAHMNNEALVSLDDGDFEVAEGQPDVRGWDVVTADQRRIGEVDDLLADPDALKVRYITIDMDRSISNATTEDQVVRVPIAHARLMEHERKVVLDVTAANVGNFETAQRRTAGQEGVTLTRAEEELRVGKRQVQTGQVEVRKTVETEHVSEPVMLRGEEVDIERRPIADGSVSGDVQIGAQEIRIPVTEEEAVVEKRPVVKEEIIIRKRATQRQQTVDADVRTERIDVERHGDIDTTEGFNRKR
jgi:uncharacterized protein (TIGR02271 family)